MKKSKEQPSFGDDILASLKHEITDIKLSELENHLLMLKEKNNLIDKGKNAFYSAKVLYFFHLDYKKIDFKNDDYRFKSQKIIMLAIDLAESYNFSQLMKIIHALFTNFICDDNMNQRNFSIQIAEKILMLYNTFGNRSDESLFLNDISIRILSFVFNCYKQNDKISFDVQHYIKLAFTFLILSNKYSELSSKIISVCDLYKINSNENLVLVLFNIADLMFLKVSEASIYDPYIFLEAFLNILIFYIRHEKIEYIVKLKILINKFLTIIEKKISKTNYEDIKEIFKFSESLIKGTYVLKKNIYLKSKTPELAKNLNNLIDFLNVLKNKFLEVGLEQIVLRFVNQNLQIISSLLDILNTEDSDYKDLLDLNLKFKEIQYFWILEEVNQMEMDSFESKTISAIRFYFLSTMNQRLNIYVNILEYNDIIDYSEIIKLLAVMEKHFLKHGAKCAKLSTSFINITQKLAFKLYSKKKKVPTATLR